MLADGVGELGLWDSWSTGAGAEMGALRFHCIVCNAAINSYHVLIDNGCTQIFIGPASR